MDCVIGVHDTTRSITTRDLTGLEEKAEEILTLLMEKPDLLAQVAITMHLRRITTPWTNAGGAYDPHDPDIIEESTRHDAMNIYDDPGPARVFKIL